MVIAMASSHMVELGDVSGFEQQFRAEQERLEKAPIPDEDRQAIQRFLNRNIGDLEPATLAQYVERQRMSSKRGNTPLVELGEQGFWNLRTTLLTEHNLAESTVFQYMVSVRQLMKFLDGREWIQDIELKKPDEDTVDPDEILTPEDVNELRKAAQRPRNTAFIQFLGDTGARITMAASLRVKDIEIDTDKPYYRPNPEATGLKNAPIKQYPIIDSKAALRNYLRHSHPHPEDGEKALFHRFDNSAEDGSGALSTDQFRRILKTCADRAGIDKSVSPHQFRHSAITRMDREGYDRSEIEHRVGWNIDSEMWDRYLHLKTEELNNGIYSKSGMADQEDHISAERVPCSNCREPIPPESRYCDWCGEPASKDAREEEDEFTNDVLEKMRRGDLTPRQRENLANGLEAVMSHPKATPHDSND